MPADDPRYVFVLGTGRCGSTLVHEVLARHPDMAFVSNIDDNLPGFDVKGRWNNTLFRRVPPRFTQKGRLRYAPSEAYGVLDRRVSPMLSEPFRDLVGDDATPWVAERLRGFFAERAAAQRRPTLLHKFTGWPRARFLREVFPGARFVHIVRDGRAVANSWLQMDWWQGWQGPDHWQWGPLPPAYRDEWERSGRSFVLLAGLAWKLLIDAFDECRSEIGDDWVELRYEDVVADPRRHFAEMLAFAGADWCGEFERGLGRYRFSAGRTEAFRRDLSADHVRLLDASLGARLDGYGYPVTPA